MQQLVELLLLDEGNVSNTQDLLLNFSSRKNWDICFDRVCLSYTRNGREREMGDASYSDI